ncbi:hypothetical protein EG329_007025 [Mollisiaceae sp. DMI_Dod_QoI]|nr:hypothetical protein EG329_007025 [Helotiales sp. DMI_Dod_QoI]
MTPQRIQQDLNSRTPFARKYGVDLIFSAFQKSGYTPTLPHSIIPINTNKATASNETIEKHQREYLLNGFTARELTDYGAYPDLNAKPSTLRNPIDFRGKSISMVPIEANGHAYSDSLGDNPGTWCAGNPTVWGVLEPVLKLASRFLSNIQTNILVDAFLFGDFRELPPEKWTRKTPSDPPRYSFHARPVTDRDEAEVKTRLQTVLHMVLKDEFEYSIGFGHPSQQVRSGVQDPKVYQAFTRIATEGKKGRIHTVLNIDNFQPLLRNDLTVSERMAEEHFCSIIILHELMHALNNALLLRFWPDPENSRFFIKEPFFEDQIFSELGFALNLSLSGGVLVPFVLNRLFVAEDKRENYPHLGFWLMSYPLSGRYAVSDNQNFLDDATPPESDTFRPIPADYYENVQQEEFWDLLVRKYGVEVARPYPTVHVTRDSSSSVFTSPMVSIKIPEWEKNWHDAFRTSILEQSSASIEELISYLPDERKDLAIELQAKLNAIRVEERASFRNGRSDFASKVRRQWEIVDSSWDYDTEQLTINKLKALSTFLQQEAENHSTEIAKFMIRKDKDVAHRAYLLELNHHMRNMATNFKASTERLRTKSEDIQEAVDETIARFNTCLMMLHEKDIKAGISRYEFYNQTREKVKPEAIEALTLQTCRGWMNEDERTFVILMAEQAIKNKNKAKCGELGERLLVDFANFPFFSAIGKILLSSDGKPEHRDLANHLGHLERASLERENNVCPELIRKRWLEIWTTRTGEYQQMSAVVIGNLSSRSPAHSDSDEETIVFRGRNRQGRPSSQIADCMERSTKENALPSIQNRIFLKKFGIDDRI